MHKTTELVLAPIRGITDCYFRQLFHRYFPGFDSALAPFINPQRFSHFQAKQVKDLLPELNQGMCVTPQLLHTNAEDFLFLASRLHELGYTEINWNLGCPAPMVTKKKRGSGLLPHPDEIITFLDTVLPRLPVKLSIKTRLGLNRNDELLNLLPRLKDYPISEIIIHGRLGSQLYRGTIDQDAFAECLGVSSHSIVYNGDICTLADFKRLEGKFPTIQKWMIGRGALANPFLAGEIKGIATKERLKQLHGFHQELFDCYRELLSGQAHLLGRLKQLWFYLSDFFPPQQKTWKKIKKCKTEEKYRQLVEELFQEASNTSL